MNDYGYANLNTEANSTDTQPFETRTLKATDTQTYVKPDY